MPLILVIYVDDLFFTGDERLIGDCKSNLAVEFEMKDLGMMHYFLGFKVWKRDGCFFIGQGKYAIEILKRFRMEDCNLCPYLSFPTGGRLMHRGQTDLILPCIVSLSDRLCIWSKLDQKSALQSTL